MVLASLAVEPWFDRFSLQSGGHIERDLNIHDRAATLAKDTSSRATAVCLCAIFEFSTLKPQQFLGQSIEWPSEHYATFALLLVQNLGVSLHLYDFSLPSFCYVIAISATINKVSLFFAAPVTISLQKEAEFGFMYAVTGGGAALGDWNPAQAAVLDWSEGHIWSKTLVRS